MLDYHAASDRAVRFAIKTGDMPNLHLIHALQRHEGFEACFGRETQVCERTHCRWHSECMALVRFDPDGRSPAISQDQAPHGSKSVPMEVLGIPAMTPPEGEKVVTLTVQTNPGRDTASYQQTISHS